MLSQGEVILFSVSVIVLLPIVVLSLARGSQQRSSGSFLGKYYAAEKHLGLVGDLFLVAVCASGLSRLAAHFNFISAETFAWLEFAVGVPFGLLLVAVLVLWIKAILKIRRERRTAV